MSKSNVIIKGISLYDIDLESDSSCNEEVERNELSTVESPKFVIKKEKNFNHELEKVNEITNSSEILRDIKTEEAVELTSTNLDENLANFKKNIEDESEIVRQSWLDQNEDDNLSNHGENSKNFEVENLTNQGNKLEENASRSKIEINSKSPAKELDENFTDSGKSRKRILNFARKSTSSTNSLQNLQEKAKSLGISIKTSPCNLKIQNSLSLNGQPSEFDENIKIKEEILDFSDSQSVPVKISTIIEEPPRKIAKININEIPKFKIIKATSISDLNEPKFVKILSNQQNGNSIVSQEIKQEPEENIINEHKYFTDEDDSESDETEKIEKKNDCKDKRRRSNRRKNHKRLSQMFQNTLKNQVEALKDHKSAESETAAASQNSNETSEVSATTSTPVRVPKTITISKISSAKKLGFKKPEFSFMKFKCHLCLRVYSSHSERLKHMKEFHNESPELMRFRCIKCNASFQAKEELLAHVDKHEKAFKCSVCENEFSHYFRLQEHLLLHKDHNAFTCKLCDKKFSGNDALNHHTRIYHSKSSKCFKCGVCDYETLIKQNFEKHERMHLRMAEKLRSNKFFYCKFCPQSFRDENVLKAHISFMHQ